MGGMTARGLTYCRLVSGRAWFGFFEGVVAVSVGGPE